MITPSLDNPMRPRRHWRWHGGNCSKLLVDGAQFYPAMLEAIHKAREQLLLEYYFVRSGKLMDQLILALVDACSRGVVVCLLIDGFGSRGLTSHDRQRLQRAGVEIRIYNPLRLANWSRNFARNHRKLLLVDSEMAFIGGAGLTDEFFCGVDDDPPWHELVLQVRGPVVADWQRLFFSLWRWLGRETDTTAAEHDSQTEWVPCGSQRMKIATTAGPHQQEIKVNFRRQINQAQKRIWLMTAYFLPSWSIRRALRRAARRGVQVSLLLPGPYTDHPWLYHSARRYYRQLLLAGVRIYEYQPRFVHAKVAVCDHWTSLGSCNMDHWNLRWNLEANQEVDDQVLATQVVAAIEADLPQCQEITLSYWQSRPRLHRALSFVVGYVSASLLRLFS